ncbi:unnamed protein product [Caenorhabditis angaria]|uniref:Uncharacterized protein n=1 Tax=Caenorhabditis angaria TaxID=860376 RepID=A0A9P1ILA4_9PELO|nr:unnamed protein product [Caenorhabditis angaria]
MEDYPRILEYEIDGEEKELIIYQEVISDVGGVVWDSALMATYYFIKNHRKWQEKTVLELGSGTGICGIALAALGAQKVIASDLENQINLLNRNIKANNLSNIESRALDWTKDAPPRNLDLLLAVDCIYYLSSIFPLIDFLKNSDAKEILIVSEKRDIGEASRAQNLFFEKIEEFFNVINVPKCEFDKHFYADDIIFVNLIKK